jgi:cation transport ATPase
MLKYLQTKSLLIINSNAFKLTAALLPASLIFYYSYLFPSIGLLTSTWQMALPIIATIGVGIAGFDYLSNFYHSIKAYIKNIWQYFKHKTPITMTLLDMSALVSLSIISNLAYGLMLGVSAPLVIYTAPLFTLGALNISNFLKNFINKRLEARANKKIESLKAKLPTEEEFNLIFKDNRVQVLPGQLIPVSGYLESDQALLNDGTMNTGEHGNIESVSKGQLLIAGSENIGKTPIFIQALTNGTDSPVYKLLQAMDRKINSSAKASAIDYIAMIFVPIVLGISTITFGFWAFQSSVSFGLNAMMDVLFAACPCALGLANTIPYGILKQKLFSNNIYIHHDQIIDKFKYADTIVFDKTGTLTKISLKNINKFSEQEIDFPAILALQKLRITEQNSVRASDPFANELISVLTRNKVTDKAISASSLKLEDNQSHGLSVKLMDISTDTDGKKIFMGNLLYLQQQGFDISKFEQPKTKPLSGSTSGSTSESLSKTRSNLNTEVYLAIEENGKKYIQASFNFKQHIRDDARVTISNLQQQGYKVVMLTGDKSENADSVAKELNIREFKAEYTPKDKEAYIKKLILKYKRNVIMVGDGYNDFAPASIANIGSIAIGRQSMMSGFFDLTIEKLTDILKLKSLFKSASSTQNQVFSFSLIYNFIAMTLAAIVFPATGMISMTGCFGMCMALSSLVATAWSITLYPRLSSVFNKFRDIINSEKKSQIHDSGKILCTNPKPGKASELIIYQAKQDLITKTESKSSIPSIYNLESKQFPTECSLYQFSIDVHAICGNCAKHFDTYMKDLKGELGFINYKISSDKTTYTIIFYYKTDCPKTILEKFRQKFIDNGKKILKEPSAKLLQVIEHVEEKLEAPPKEVAPSCCLRKSIA